jgi:hypothetical protein
MKKYAAGGSTTNKLNKPKGFAKPTTGGSNTKNGIYAIPNAGPTGPNKTGTYDYKKGGAIGKAKFGASTPVKASCKKGEVRSASGGCVSERPKFQAGGAIKKMQNGGKINYLPSKAAYEKSLSYMGGPDNPPVQLEPREIYKAKMDQKKRSVVNKMYPTTGIPKKGVGAKKYAKGGSSFGMLSVKAGVDKNPKPTAADRIAGAKMQNGGTTPRNITVNSRPVPKTKYTQPSKKPMMAKKGGLVKKQLGGPATSTNPNPTRALENAALFIGGGLATALAARKQNQPMTQKKKEKIMAKQQKQAMRKKK